MVDLAATVFRDFETDGVPASGAHKPKKAKIREWGSYVETGILGGLAGSAVFASKATLDATLTYAANTMAWVIGDATTANNGIYRKSGGSGSGSWSRLGDLPHGFIRASNTGAGAANAIQATTSIPIPTADGGALIALPIVADNTASPVTVSFNDSAPLTIKTNSGNDVAPGGLVAGMRVAGYVSGSAFRLLSDQAASALLVQMEAILTQVEDAAVSAAGAVPVADRAALKALNPTAKKAAVIYGEGGRNGLFLWQAGDYSAQVAGDPLEGVHIKANAVASTAGAWVRVVDGAINVLWFGANRDGAGNSTAAIDAAVAVAGVGGTVYFPKGVYIFSDINGDGFGLVQLSGQAWFGDGAASVLRLAASTTTINVAVTAADFATDVTIRDMQIDGNRGNITPASDLYNTFNLVRGPRGGRRMKWRNLILSNSWGRSLQTSNESASEYARDAVIDNVSVVNGGTKGISVTRTRKATVSNCFSEINPYTAADHPGGVGDGNAASGSCFEMNQTGDVSFVGNHGVQIGSTIVGPGFRIVNGNYNIQISGNTIEAASYVLFAQNCNDVDFYGNAARNIRGNAFLIADAEGEAANITCRRVRVHHNTVYDCTAAFVLVKADKSAAPPFVECYIYDNDFIDNAGAATHGIYNYGVVAPATGGTCRVYAWDNNIVGAGVAAAPFAGPAAHEIQDGPQRRWRILAQSSAPVSLTGTTAETTMANVIIPQNRMGKNGIARVTATFSYPNNANTKITRVRFGGLQAYAATNTTSLQQRFQVEIGNRASLGSQFVAIAGSVIGFGNSSGAPQYMSISTTADQPMAITGQLGNTSDTLILESYTVELCYGL